MQISPKITNSVYILLKTVENASSRDSVITLQLALFYTTIGVITTRFLSIIFPVTLGDFEIHISFFAMIVLCWSTITLIFPMQTTPHIRTIATTFISIGSILDETFWMIVRNPPLVPGSPDQVGYWSLESMIFTIFSFTILILLIWLATSKWREYKPIPQLTWWEILIFILILYAGLIAFQMSQASIRFEVPNAERSLMILGYEIHHIVQGQFILMIAIILMLTASGRPLPRRISFILATLGCLFVADQILYYQFDSVTDERYFGTVTRISGAFACSIMACRLIYLKLKNSEDPGGEEE